MVQNLAVVAIDFGHEHIPELEIGQDGSLYGRGVGTVQRRAGEILMVHEAAHERHNCAVAERPLLLKAPDSVASMEKNSVSICLGIVAELSGA